MQDNFNIHEWRLNRAINEEKSVNVTFGDEDWSQSIAYKLSDALIKAGYSRDMIKQVAKSILTRPSLQEGKQLCKECGSGYMEEGQCMECGYMEEGATFTDKHDDNPKLKGGQKKLPDELQAQLVKKEGEGEDHEVAMAKSSLQSIMSSASKLMVMLGDEERNIPGWIQDHITNAENYIDQAAQGFHELENDNEEN